MQYTVINCGMVVYFFFCAETSILSNAELKDPATVDYDLSHANLRNACKLNDDSPWVKPPRVKFKL